MSKFLNPSLTSLVPYVPGEQPQNRQYIKLNTNESPFPPSPRAVRAAAEEAGRLQLYSDPDCRTLVCALAKFYGVPENMVIVTNGSDEILNFSFLAFADESHPLIFPDITYGFYPVFAGLNRIPFETVPLGADFSIDIRDYMTPGKTVVIANPNAPTGIALSRDEIEKIVAADTERIVIIDEAYVDFGGESAVPLTLRYPNLLVTGTFSKSRGMAGARLGFGIGAPELIADLNTIRFSTNPYNVNRMTMAAGVAALEDVAYNRENCRIIQENLAYTAEKMRELGFTVTDSKANFIFAASPNIGGDMLYRKLKERGILVRHLNEERIREYNRITIGTREQMDCLLSAVKEILKETEDEIR